MKARSLALILVLSALSAEARPQEPALDAETRAMLDRITPDSLRGHLSFLASDLLEGRDTPSRGLDIASEYLAAQFRRAGLEEVGPDGYFQIARWAVSEPDADGFRLEFGSGPDEIRVRADRVSGLNVGPRDLKNAPIYKLDASAPLPKAAEVADRIVIVEPAGEDGDRLLNLIVALRPLAVLAVDRDPESAVGLRGGRLIDLESRRWFEKPRGSASPLASVPRLLVHDRRVADLFDRLPFGASDETVRLKIAPNVARSVALRNVAGILRGSDPVLKNTYILVSAHYDHVGIGSPIGKDRIYNGANDDGSGTVSVVEIASALATLKERPKRSILFLGFWGEEKGLLGSRYYGRHPIVPVDDTVAAVNLEQVGRTDDSEGPRVSAAAVTGFDYSEVGAILRDAGLATGVKISKHPRFSDAYFGASDNQALADLGVPSHTVCTAFAFSDYHKAGDHWQKVDYDNMAKIDRAVALGVLALANRAEAPKWDEANPRARRYVQALKKRQEARPGR